MSLPMLSLLTAAAIQAANPTPYCPAALTPGPGALCPTLVFFDSSKAEIDRDAATALDGVLATWRSGGFTRIILTGHGDLSGPTPANRRVAQQRAQAIANWLGKRGLPSTSVQVRTLGESESLIPTADGVREPQNRRVEVRLER